MPFTSTGINEYHQSHSANLTYWTTSRKNNKLIPLCYAGYRMLFGIEDEVEMSDSCIERVDAANEVRRLADNRVTIETDGSLSRGFEIISEPATLDAHRLMGWDKITSYLNEIGYKSHDTDTCGLHVHVSKAALGSSPDAIELCISKIMILMDHWYENEYLKFSRRETLNNLNRWSKKNLFKKEEHDNSAILRRKVRDEISNGDRYRVINLTNRNTIELRGCRGTLNKDTILATIQFLAAMCLYCKTHILQEVDALTFGQLVAEFPEFVELKNYCNRRGIC